MNIRLFRPDDIDQCLSLFIDVFKGEPWNDKWSRESAEQYLMDYINTPGFKGIVAEQKKVIYGLIFGTSKRWWKGNEFFINEMCVRTDKQRSGIGTKMFEYLDTHLNDEGIETITLLTNRGIAAEEFYKKNRFQEVNRIVFMAKKIES